MLPLSNHFCSWQWATLLANNASWLGSYIATLTMIISFFFHFPITLFIIFRNILLTNVLFLNLALPPLYDLFKCQCLGVLQTMPTDMRALQDFEEDDKLQIKANDIITIIEGRSVYAWQHSAELWYSNQFSDKNSYFKPTLAVQYGYP